MRKDGIKVKSHDAEYAIVPHIMVERNDALNLVELNIPLQPMQDFLNAKRKEGIRMSHMAVMIAAYVRTVAEFPMLNRFIVNKRIYARTELTAAMVILKAGQMDNGSMSKVNLDPSDTILEVNDKINEYVEKNKKEDSQNKTDKLANKLVGIPGLLRVGVNFLKFLDRHNLLPRAIIEASPFHSSFSITNLASIRTNHIFHHIYNFGTTSVFISMGNPREVAKRDKNGEIVFERCLPLGVTMDERLCSGSYLALAFRVFNKYLTNPQLLESEPEKVIREVPYRTEKK